MFRDVMLAVDSGSSAEASLDAAVELASGADGRVHAVVPMDALPAIPSDWGVFPASLYTQLFDDAQARAEKLADALRSRQATTPRLHEVRVATAQLMHASQALALHARHADAVVLGRPRDATQRAISRDLFADLVLGAGRPLLLVPEGSDFRFRSERVAIAWTPTRESSRALHDALPLLRAAAQVDLLMVDPRIGEGQHGEQPGADIAAHLARHDVRVDVLSLPDLEQDDGSVLLRQVQESGADLVVAGAYGHSRMRQNILGGTTRTLFERSPVPVLFSH